VRWARVKLMHACAARCLRESFDECDQRTVLRRGPSAGFFFGPSALQTAPDMGAFPTHAWELESPATVAGKGRQ
jgi:hypothetical protein